MRKLIVLTMAALVVCLALVPAVFAKGKPNPLPGPSVVTAFDGDVYLFVNADAATAPDPATAPWGKFSWDLWGEELMFHFKADNLTASTGPYNLKFGGTQIASGNTDSSGNLSLQGPFAATGSLSGAVTLDGPGTATDLTSFYSVKFTYVPPAP